jgi:hypothetical protein
MPRLPQRVQGCSTESDPLRDEGVPIFAISTYDADYVLIKEGPFFFLEVGILAAFIALQLQTDPASLECLLRRHTFLRAHNREFLVSARDRGQRTSLAPCRNWRVGRQTAHPEFSGEESEFQLHDLLAKFSMQKGCRTQTIA